MFKLCKEINDLITTLTVIIYIYLVYHFTKALQIKIK